MFRMMGATLASLVLGVIVGAEAVQQDGQAMLDKVKGRQARFDEVLFGGKPQFLDAMTERVGELCELLEEDTAQSEHLFHLGSVALLQEAGWVLPGRSDGVQLMGGLEIMLESFDPDAEDWVLQAPMTYRLLPEDSRLKEQLGEENAIRIPKGRFVKFITNQGIWDGGADPDDFERYALFIGLDAEQALIVYPNEKVAFDPWIAWVPGKSFSSDWDRPKLPRSVHEVR
jgi:hypothetical protein